MTRKYIELNVICFIRFAIIWIPLLLLVVLNTMLIHYVRRSKTNRSMRNPGEVELRRHTRGNQGEQRKTTIMLSKIEIERENDMALFSL